MSDEDAFVAGTAQGRTEPTLTYDAMQIGVGVWHVARVTGLAASSAKQYEKRRDTRIQFAHSRRVSFELTAMLSRVNLVLDDYRKVGRAHSNKKVDVAALPLDFGTSKIRFLQDGECDGTCLGRLS